MTKAIDIIHDEHRALAAVLEALKFMVNGIRDKRFAPDFKLFATMIDYITGVPEKLHHPKEEDYLFAKLRQRSAEAVPVLDELLAQHRNGPAAVQKLGSALIHYQSAGEAGFDDFAKAVDTYLTFNWEHMNLEEQKVMPLARQALTADDWAEINAAFEANDNPWAGKEGEFAQLFTRIVNMVPAPLGLGQA
ncbi:MAG TPA: hemerythrin domain-containing protein [Rhodocyclaceae bacterium]|nr:hemerythrin domain-containing protein [Rhodocyclaceae bacterium]